VSRVFLFCSAGRDSLLTWAVRRRPA
jgi:hypothetical protein